MFYSSFLYGIFPVFPPQLFHYFANLYLSVASYQLVSFLKVLNHAFNYNSFIQLETLTSTCITDAD